MSVITQEGQGILNSIHCACNSESMSKITCTAYSTHTHAAMVIQYQWCLPLPYDCLASMLESWLPNVDHCQVRKYKLKCIYMPRESQI